MSNETRATAAVIDYVTKSGLDRFPSEAVSLAKQCIIDGLGVILAGSAAKEPASSATTCVPARKPASRRCSAATCLHAVPHLPRS